MDLARPALRRFVLRWTRPVAIGGFWGSLLAVSMLCLVPSDSVYSPGVVDKVKHAIAYAAIAGFGFIAYPERHFWVPIAVGSVLWGIAIEFGQRLVPGRSFEIADMVANTAGVIFAASILVRYRSIS